MEHNQLLIPLGARLCETYKASAGLFCHLSKGTPAGCDAGRGEVAVFSLGLVFRLLPVLFV